MQTAILKAGKLLSLNDDQNRPKHGDPGVPQNSFELQDKEGSHFFIFVHRMALSWIVWNSNLQILVHHMKSDLKNP